MDTRFAKGQAADLAAALIGLGGPILVAWRRQEIGAIIGGLGTVDPTPPASWPSDRFDVVYVLTHNGSGWAFSQVPQMLLAGDSPMPIASARRRRWLAWVR